MKRNKVFLLGIITVFVAVLSFTLVSGTYAKYTSTATGSDTVDVAAWAFTIDEKKFGNSGAAFTEEFNFNFWTTITEDDGTTENEVAAGHIAPGTKGVFELNVANDSDVTATVAYKFVFTGLTEDLAKVLKFATADSEANLADYKVLGMDNGEYVLTIAAKELAYATGTDTLVIGWQWAFDNGDDGRDTSIGIAAPSVTVTASVICTQVN